MKLLVFVIVTFFSTITLAGLSPSEQLAIGKGYYYGVDREKNSGLACFWLKSADIAGGNASAFISNACNDAKLDGYDISYINDLVDEYQKTGRAPSKQHLIKNGAELLNGRTLQSGGAAPKFDITNTSYKESDAHSRVPIEKQIAEAERQVAQQQAAEEAAKNRQMEQLIQLRREEVHLLRDQGLEQQRFAEESRKREIREKFERQRQMDDLKNSIQSGRQKCSGQIDAFGNFNGSCY